MASSISSSVCTVCKLVCHVMCREHVFTACGSATRYAHDYAETLRQARTTPTMRLAVDDLKLSLSTHMKVPR